MAESIWLAEVEEAASRLAQHNPAVPATEAGRRLAVLMSGSRTFQGLPAGCGQSDSCHISNTEAIIELWCSPARAVATTGCQLPDDGVLPVNLWVAKIDGTLASQRGFHHRGQALDCLAEQLDIASGTPASTAKQDASVHLDTTAEIIEADGTLPLLYTGDC